MDIKSRYWLLVVGLLLLVSCKRNSSKYDDNQVFRYNEHANITTLDPAFAKNKQVMWAVHQVYNTLIEIDSTMQMAPSLAKRWMVSPDNKTFTFYFNSIIVINALILIKIIFYSILIMNVWFTINNCK
mgnify:CR=1 FL=1